MNRFHILRFLFPALLFGAVSGMAQLDQVGAIRDFSIPRFNDQGDRLWLLQGKELKRQAKEVAFVLEMDLQTYDPGRGTPETRDAQPIRSFPYEKQLGRERPTDSHRRARLRNFRKGLAVERQPWTCFNRERGESCFRCDLDGFSWPANALPDEPKDSPSPPLAVRTRTSGFRANPDIQRQARATYHGQKPPVLVFGKRPCFRTQPQRNLRSAGSDFQAFGR